MANVSGHVVRKLDDLGAGRNAKYTECLGPVEAGVGVYELEIIAEGIVALDGVDLDVVEHESVVVLVDGRVVVIVLGLVDLGDVEMSSHSRVLGRMG